MNKALPGYLDGGYDPGRYLVLKRVEGDDANATRAGFTIHELAGPHDFVKVAGDYYQPVSEDAHRLTLNVDEDPHARVAVQAYAMSVALENRPLSNDLMKLLADTKRKFDLKQNTRLNMMIERPPAAPEGHRFD